MRKFAALLCVSLLPSLAPAAVTDVESAEIYSGVIARMVTADNSYARDLKTQRVVVEQAVLANCVHSSHCEDKIVGTLSEEARHEIQVRLAQAGITVGFVDARQSNLARFSDSPDDHVHVLSLREIEFGTPGTASVNAKILSNVRAGTENHYEFHKEAGHWKLLKMVPLWIA